ncbi:cytochrome P450 [Mycena capillaripes]|nr:cytochrome P450 [Mycena capillaripes]
MDLRSGFYFRRKDAGLIILLSGHRLQLLLPRQYGDHEFAWQKVYGPVYRLMGCFGYILNSPYFERGPSQKNQHRFTVPGEMCYGYARHSIVLTNVNIFADETTAGEVHKRLRAAMNIGFTAAAVRNYQPIFEKMTDRFEEASASPIDVCPILSDATLSTISEAALGYPIEDLDQELVAYNERLLALTYVQSPGQICGEAVGTYLPKWVSNAAIYLPTETYTVIRTAKYLANQVGEKIVRKKRKRHRRDWDLLWMSSTRSYSSPMETTSVYLEQKKNKLSESEITAQTGILLLGGQDTMSNTLAFGLVELARNPEFQDKLRAEIQSSLGATVVYDMGPLHERVALRDTIIPLAEGIVTSTGEIMTQLPVRKGQTMNIAIASYQRLESRWGEDAHEFKPSRWIDGTINQGQAVGPYANLLTFLGGPRTCLGWRFAVLEMQVFFAELVGKFSFALPTEGDSIRMWFAGSLMPILPNGEKGARLLITRI